MPSRSNHINMCCGLLKYPEGEGGEKKKHFGNEGIMVVIKENLGK